MITLELASIIVDSALAHGRELELPPMTVAVLDAAGNLVAFKREDNSSLLRPDIANAKAWGALGMGVGTRALQERVASHPHFINAINSLANGRVIPVAGGVLVRSADNRIIGAVGVSGHMPDNDEACAIYGIAAAELISDAG